MVILIDLTGFFKIKVDLRNPLRTYIHKNAFSSLRTVKSVTEFRIKRHLCKVSQSSREVNLVEKNVLCQTKTIRELFVWHGAKPSIPVQWFLAYFWPEAKMVTQMRLS